MKRHSNNSEGCCDGKGTCAGACAGASTKRPKQTESYDIVTMLRIDLLLGNTRPFGAWLRKFEAEIKEAHQTAKRSIKH